MTTERDDEDSNPLGSSLLPSNAARFERRIGIGPEAQAAILEDWIHAASEPLLCVVAAKATDAAQLAADLRYFQSQARGAERSRFLYLPPAPDDPDSSETFETASERTAALLALAALDTKSPQTVLVATAQSLSQPVPSRQRLAQSRIELVAGQAASLSELCDQLLALDYDSESLCEAPGQFARRGGIVDVYPITADRPYRIDFFGDEIESIKELDPVTQRSSKSVDSVEIAAAPTVDFQPAASGSLDYLPGSIGWALVEPESVLESVANPTVGRFWIRLRDSRENRADSWTTISDLDLEAESDGDLATVTYEAESLSFYRPLADSAKMADERLADEQAARLRFLAQLREWQRDGQRIVFVLPNTSDENRVKETIEQSERTKGLQAEFWSGDLNQGFRIHFRPRLGQLDWPSLKGSKGVVFVTETELFGRRRRRHSVVKQRALVAQSQVDQLLDFAELVEGEFVVHLQHGIAHYRGITKVELRGQLREVLSLEFDDGMILHVPLQESHLISRYLGLSKVRPKLGKLGSNRWAKTREAAERATLDLAAQLLQMQAARDLGEGHAFSPDTEWQREFESAFPYTETPDQMKAIVETKADMEKVKPMDRLICGDVGYGKTEVAIRAAFKAVMDGKQVAILVPTTVLAQQHFINIRDRMAGYPIVVEHLSRFRKPADAKKIVQAVKQGKVDIIVGTHRLFQKDMAFKDLGLVVVDEEQRFGVKHKEVFKQWRLTVDMLTMSATPIPRTLYMALTGARELSVIETPPQERKPIQTFVKSYDDKLVCEVIRREIARDGQVFYLHNRVQTIDTVAAKLQSMMPEISFGVGHGQMDERELEQVMLDFVDGRYQALVCTTIIESGLDIPNCNTIIIEGADRFGLGQLYQLRGRVGRFKRQAYAYLLLKKHQRLMDVARERLKAIRQHNQLGAGFRIAMRDLELRGAGNLLGPQQSGHIVGVGFELYCQLLRQSVARLKGESGATTIRATVKLDFVYQGEGQMELQNRQDNNFATLQRIDLKEGECEPIQARIPASYLEETRLRIDLYRRLAMADSPLTVRQLREGIVDRFGPFPAEVEALLRLTEIRALAEAKGIVSVESQGNRLKCRLSKPQAGSDLVMLGTRFPRLSKPDGLARLNEIIVFLRNFTTT